MSERGAYWYRKGVNPAAVIATAVGASVATVPVLVPNSVVSWMHTAAQYSWFIGMGLGMGLVVYYLLAGSSQVVATSLAPPKPYSGSLGALDRFRSS